MWSITTLPQVKKNPLLYNFFINFNENHLSALYEHLRTIEEQEKNKLLLLRPYIEIFTDIIILYYYKEESEQIKNYCLKFFKNYTPQQINFEISMSGNPAFILFFTIIKMTHLIPDHKFEYSSKDFAKSWRNPTPAFVKYFSSFLHLYHSLLKKGLDHPFLNTITNSLFEQNAQNILDRFFSSEQNEGIDLFFCFHSIILSNSAPYAISNMKQDAYLFKKLQELYHNDSDIEKKIHNLLSLQSKKNALSALLLSDDFIVDDIREFIETDILDNTNYHIIHLFYLLYQYAISLKKASLKKDEAILIQEKENKIKLKEKIQYFLDRKNFQVEAISSILSVLEKTITQFVESRMIKELEIFCDIFINLYQYGIIESKAIEEKYQKTHFEYMQINTKFITPLESKGRITEENYVYSLFSLLYFFEHNTKKIEKLIDILSRLNLILKTLKSKSHHYYLIHCFFSCLLEIKNIKTKKSIKIFSEVIVRIFDFLLSDFADDITYNKKLIKVTIHFFNLNENGNKNIEIKDKLSELSEKLIETHEEYSENSNNPDIIILKNLLKKPVKAKPINTILIPIKPHKTIEKEPELTFESFYEKIKNLFEEKYQKIESRNGTIILTFDSINTRQSYHATLKKAIQNKLNGVTIDGKSIIFSDVEKNKHRFQLLLSNQVFIRTIKSSANLSQKEKILERVEKTQIQEVGRFDNETWLSHLKKIPFLKEWAEEYIHDDNSNDIIIEIDLSKFINEGIYEKILKGQIFSCSIQKLKDELLNLISDKVTIDDNGILTIILNKNNIDFNLWETLSKKCLKYIKEKETRPENGSDDDDKKESPTNENKESILNFFISLLNLKTENNFNTYFTYEKRTLSAKKNAFPFYNKIIMVRDLFKIIPEENEKIKYDEQKNLLKFPKNYTLPNPDLVFNRLKSVPNAKTHRKKHGFFEKKIPVLKKPSNYEIKDLIIKNKKNFELSKKNCVSFCEKKILFTNQLKGLFDSLVNLTIPLNGSNTLHDLQNNILSFLKKIETLFPQDFFIQNKLLEITDCENLIQILMCFDKIFSELSEFNNQRSHFEQINKLLEQVPSEENDPSFYHSIHCFLATEITKEHLKTVLILPKKEDYDTFFTIKELHDNLFSEDEQRRWEPLLKIPQINSCE